MKTVLALDLGSTQLKCMLMDENARIVDTVTRGYPTFAPRPGWLEQSPADWERAMKEGLSELLGSHPEAELCGIGFSGHMSGTVLLSREGQVLRTCIMLSDSRSDEECALLEQAAGDKIRAHTGNPVINAFSLPKLLWIKRHEPDIWEKTAAWISPKDYLRYLLTSHVATEYTDAYNSLCIDQKTAAWCEEILSASGLERDKFPEVLTPVTVAGRVTEAAASLYGLPAGVPVVCGGADMACGAVGTGLFETGDTALTLGTCATYLAVVPKAEDQGFGKVTFHLHALPGLLYALGSHFNGGQAVNWLTQTLMPDGSLDYGEIAKLSREAEGLPVGCDGLVTIPFLAGSGSPYFDGRDTQTVIGLNMSTGRAAIFKSELEGITLNLDETRQLFGKIVPGGIRRTLLGGGGVKIGIWPQMIADVFGEKVSVIRNADASTAGAAYLAGMAVGLFPDIEKTVRRGLELSKELEADRGRHEQYTELAARYHRLYEAVKALQ